jgi:hypothetical protein
MPIDEGLTQLPEKEKIDIFIVKKQEPSDLDKKRNKVMLSYIENLKILTNNNFSEETVRKFVDYIRFKDDLSLKVLPIPKEEFVEIIKEGWPDLHFLIKNTDVNEILPPIIYNNEKTDYNGIIELKRIIENFDKLTTCSGKNLIIKNLESMSLFMKTGDKLKKYVMLSEFDYYDKNTLLNLDKQSENIRVNFNQAIFSARNLRKYYTETNDSELTGMINELKQIKDLLNQTDETKVLEKKLFERLQTYSPELIYKRGDK